MRIVDKIFDSIASRAAEKISESLPQVLIHKVRDGDIVMLPSSTSNEEFLEISDVLLSHTGVVLVMTGSRLDILRIENED